MIIKINFELAIWYTVYEIRRFLYKHIFSDMLTSVLQIYLNTRLNLFQSFAYCYVLLTKYKNAILPKFILVFKTI